MHVVIEQEGDSFRIKDAEGDYLQESSYATDVATVTHFGPKSGALLRHNGAIMADIAKKHQLKVVKAF